METKKETVIQSLIIILYSIFGYTLIQNTGTPIIHVAVLFGLAAIAVAIVKFDIFHPFSWLSIFFALYNGAYALSLSTGYNSNLGYTNNNILLPFICLSIILLLIGPRKYNLKREKNRNEQQEETVLNSKFIKVVLFTLSFITVIFSAILLSKGYAGKLEIKQANDIFYRIAVYLVRFTSMFLILLMIAKRNEKWNNKLVFFAILSTIIFSLITGERDSMFRSIASLLLMLFGLNRIKKKHLAIIIPIFVILMVVSVAFKYYFSKGTINVDYLNMRNLLHSFLSSDFMSAGENLQKLLITPWTKGALGVGLVFSEIMSFLLPSSMIVNPDTWFNYQVYTGAYHGRAFTLVGTGYVADGVLGVILISIILALLIKFLYKKSANSLYMLAIYVYMITTIIFSFRQSLAVISTSLFRVAILSVLICKLTTKRSYISHHCINTQKEFKKIKTCEAKR